MNSDVDLVKTVLGLLCGIGHLRQKKMFGGIYIYCDDLFIATVHDGKLYFKANKNTAQEFIERGLLPFTYPKAGEIVTLQYFQAPSEVFDSGVTMKHWANKALVAARQDAALKKPRRADGRQA